MRFSREALLTRLLADQASGVRLLEAPVGFGKSWLLRKASPRGTLRMRGEIGELLALAPGSTVPVSIDDAHLLAPGDVDRLAEWIEEVADDRWVIVAGRFLPKAIRDAGDLVDATRFDSAALSITAGEIAEVLPTCTQRDATRIVETAEGCVKFIASGLEQCRRDPSGDPVTEIASVLRASAAASLHSLSSSDGGLVGMLARAPGIDERFLDKLGGPGFVERIVTAGVPLRRRIDGTIDLVNEGSFRSIDVDPATALRLRARAGRARPTHRSRRPAARRGGPRARRGGAGRAAAVGHRHRRIAHAAQRARPPRFDDRARACAAVAAIDGAVADRPLRRRRGRPRPGDGARPARRPATAAASERPARPSPRVGGPLRGGAPSRRGRAERPRRRRGAHLRQGAVGARRGGRHERPPRRPAAGRRVLQRGDQGVGGVRRARQGPRLPMRPRHQRARAARVATRRRSPR